MNSYPNAVILYVPYCGTKVWRCRTRAHAEGLAAEFVTMGLPVRRVV